MPIGEFMTVGLVFEARVSRSQKYDSTNAHP